MTIFFEFIEIFWLLLVEQLQEDKQSLIIIAFLVKQEELEQSNDPEVIQIV